MVLYYAMGGGLGHLVRARAVLHTLGLEKQATLLTASRHAADRRVVGDLPVLVPPDALRPDPQAVARWAAATVADLAPAELFIDAFPVGLFGELHAVKPARSLTYVARLLHWSAYEPLVRGLPWRFSRTLTVEELHPDHAAFVARVSDRVETLALVDPPTLSGPLPTLPARHTLVVHSGPDEELVELLSYAREIERRDPTSGPTPDALVLCRPGARPLAVPEILTVDVHPAVPLFGPATRIVTASGFNAMRQAAPFAAKHHVLPMARRYDDQYTRAARARRAVAPAR